MDYDTFTSSLPAELEEALRLRGKSKTSPKPSITLNCPKCGNLMTEIGEATGGFSAGKAIVGGVLLGPIGLLGGALGKKKVTYQCVIVPPKSEWAKQVGCGYTIVR